MQVSSASGVVLALLSTVLWALFWIFNTRCSTPAAVSLFLCFAAGTPLIRLLLLFQGAILGEPIRLATGAGLVLIVVAVAMQQRRAGAAA